MFFYDFSYYTSASTIRENKKFTDFSAIDIDGNLVDLAKYEGKAAIVINVASE